MRKFLVFLLLGLFLINFASAVTLTDITTWDNSIKYNSINSNNKYGYYEIADTFLWLFLRKTIKTVELIENDYSLYSAWNIKRIEVLEPTKLFDKTEYFAEDRKTDKSNVIKSTKHYYRYWIEQNKTIYERTCDRYETVLDENGTEIQNCSSYSTTSIEMDNSQWSDWENYYFQTVQSGLYQAKTIVTRGNLNSGAVDWIDTSEGFKLDEWAVWWNSSWIYKKEYTNLTGNITYMGINITVNDNSDFNDTRFISCYNDTLVFNHTLEDKVGTYGQFRVNNLGENCTDRYYGNTGASSTSSASDVYFEPIAAYYLDADANDFIGDNHGTNNGANLSLGYINGSYDFELADTDYITCGTDSSLSFDYNKSFSGFAWVNPESVSSNHQIISKFDADSPFKGWMFRIISSGLLNIDYQGTGRFQETTDDIVLNAGVWQHVGFVYNNSNITFYVNGSEVASSTDDDTLTASANNSAVPFNIGARDDQVEHFDGMIDEVYIYDKVLTPTQVNQLYTQTAPNVIEGSEQETSTSGITTTLISPSDSYSSLLQNIEFQVNSSSTNFTQMDNVTLYIWNSTGPLLISNFTSIDSNTSVESNWNNSLPDGNYIWSAETCGENGCNIATNRTFSIDTTPNIQFISPTEVTEFNSSTSVIPINVSLSETYFKNITFNVNGTKYSFTDSTRFINYSFGNGSNYYNVTICTTTNKCNSTETRVTNINNGKFLTLITPINDTIISNDTITFTTSLNSSDGVQEWINITYYIWDDDGLFESGTNNLTGFNITDNYTFINFTLGDYQWDSIAWYGDGNYEDYVWSNNGNFTFLIGATITGESHSNITYETEEETFILNVSLLSGVIPYEAILEYNGTEYVGTITDLGDDDYSLSKTIYVPLIDADVNVTFKWIFKYDDEGLVSQNSSIYDQTILELQGITITDGACGAGLFSAMFYNFSDAENLSSMYADIDYNFKFGIGALVEMTVNGELTNKSSFRICINDTIDFYRLGYGEIDYNYDGYVSRRYYMYEGQNLSNSTQMNHTLYLLPTTYSTSFIFEFKNTFLNPYTNKLVSLLRWYPEDDEYKVVEMAKTDADGQTVMKVHTEDIDYRVGLYTLNGSLLKLADPVRMACLIDPCTYTLKVIHDPVDFDALYNIESDLSWDEENNRFVYIYNDPSQSTSQMRLHVYKDAGFQEILICNDTSIGYTGVLTCNIENQTGSIIAKAYRSASPESPIAIFYHSIRDGIESSFGLFASFLITLLAALAGIFSPVASIMLLILGLIPAVFFGSITTAIFAGIALLGGIIINIIKNYS